MVRPGVHVDGLNAFVRRLREAEARTPKEVREGLNDVANIVVDDVIPHMKELFVSDSTLLDGALEDSVKAASTTREARVRVGTHKRVQYAGWWEFGGPKPENQKLARSGFWRGRPAPPPRTFKKEGRTLYPALDRREQQIINRLEDVLNRLADTANGV